MSPIMTRMVMMEYLEDVILPSLLAMISVSVLTRVQPHLSSCHNYHLCHQLSFSSLVQLDRYNCKL